MTLCSSVLGRKVISRTDCCVVGSIENAYFDKKCKNLKYFVVRCEKPTCAAGKTGDFAVPYEDAVDFNDAVVLEDTSAFLSLNDIDFTSYINDLPGKAVYTVDGELKGTVSDVAFDQKGKVEKMYFETGFFVPADFKRLGDIALLKPESPSDKPKKRRVPRPKTERKVTVLTQKQPKELKETAESPSIKTNDAKADASGTLFPTEIYSPSGDDTVKYERAAIIAEDIAESLENSSVRVDGGHTPARIICNYDFLLGRILVSDLTTYVGEQIAPAGSVITNGIVETARLSGKLVDLILNSK